MVTRHGAHRQSLRRRGSERGAVPARLGKSTLAALIFGLLLAFGEHDHAQK